jgi:hypothetical protein
MIWVLIVTILITAGIVAGVGLHKVLETEWGRGYKLEMQTTTRVKYAIICIFVIVFCLVSLFALFIKSLKMGG